MLSFEKLLPDTYVLRVPNGGEWTGVFLICGEENILIDCGPSAAAVEEYLVPALAELGLAPKDIAWLTNTHAHGDHTGGDHRFLELSGAKLAVSEEIAMKLADPLPHSIKTRVKWPEHSPKPPQFIQPNEADAVLKNGDVLAERLRLLLTPGHDTESVAFFDLKTRTLFTGDSLQEHGTIGEKDAAGVAFYKDLAAYRQGLLDMEACGAENLFAAHDFKPYGFAAFGSEAVRKLIDSSREAADLYDREIRTMREKGMTDVAKMTRMLLQKLDVVDPEYLFMAMYTVQAHLDAMDH